jgi:hypothetical protein
MGSRTLGSEPDQRGGSWPALLRGAAYLSAGAFLLTTVLYLLDAVNLVRAAPDFRHTGRGRVADEATFFAAFFNHQHAIWWDIALRDTLGPVALLSLAGVGLALANLWGWSPSMQLTVGLLSFGAAFGTVNSLLYLGELNYWRYGGWTAHPATGMVAIGRSAEGIDHLTVYPEALGYTLVAVALVVLVRDGQRGQLGAPSSALGYATATGLLGLVVSSVARLDVAYDVLAVITGIVLGPAFLVALARAAVLPFRQPEPVLSTAS